MPWVRFTEDFDWNPAPRSTIAYKAGMIQNVTRRCQEAARAAGKVVSAKTPRRPARKAADGEGS